MIVYLDTSVMLRVLFGEPNPISEWGHWEKAYSSTLIRIESLRTVDRLRLSGYLTDQEVAGLVKEIEIVYETLFVIGMTDSILRRAGDSFPTVVGTLDALHLATALSVRELEKVDLFLTHDQQLGIAAQSVGFEVIGI